MQRRVLRHRDRAAPVSVTIPALEVQEHDITVNCVLLSAIDTPADRRAMRGADPGRWARPEQVAAVIRRLTSADASAINGAAIPVYGRACPPPPDRKPRACAKPTPHQRLGEPGRRRWPRASGHRR